MIADRLKAWREARGVSRVVLAAQMTVQGRRTTPQDLERWENGKNEPKFEAVRLIAEILDVDLQELAYAQPATTEAHAS